MLKLDAAPKRLLTDTIFDSALFLVIFYFFESRTEDIDTTGMQVVWIAFAVLLSLLILAIIIVNITGSTRKKSSGGICRDPSLIFDYNNPESIIETLVLYQDYTGEKIGTTLYKNNTSNMLMFNMFEKLGWIQEKDGKLYIKNVDNNYLQRLCVRPLDNAIQAFNQVQEFNKQNWFSEKIEAPDVYKSAKGDILIYDIDKMLEYSSKVDDCLYSSAYAWRFSIINPVKYNKMSALNFKSMAEKLTYWAAGGNDDCIEYAESVVKRKYYEYKKKSWLGKKLNTKNDVFALSAILTAVLIAIYYIFAQNPLSGIEYGFELFLGNGLNFICAILGLVLGNLSLYFKSLIGEERERLNPAGQEIIDRVYGLKRFIEEFTQIDKPISNDIYRVWDEFVFFASMFGLNVKLYNVAKYNDTKFDNEKVLKYFEENRTAVKVIDTNYNVCDEIPYPDKDKYGWRVRYICKGEL